MDMSLSPPGVPDAEHALLKADDVAALLGVRKEYVWRMGQRGVLPSVKVGRHRRWRQATVRDFIARREGRPVL
jgi:excisionase family DNA binding protein